MSSAKQTQFSRKLVRNLQERAIESVLFLAALSSVATTVAILGILFYESIIFFQKVSLWEFLTKSTNLNPSVLNDNYLKVRKKRLASASALFFYFCSKFNEH